LQAEEVGVGGRDGARNYRHGNQNSDTKGKNTGKDIKL
jgi:hypothetical protein